MGRTIGSVAAGVAVWIVLVVAIDFAMSFAWPDYQAAKPDMSFSLQMKIARLAESTVALVIASLVAARIAPASRAASWALGIVLLLIFIPIHYSLWDKFPFWYHAYFLASLIAVPLIVGITSGAKRSPAAS
jgi:hypothetical protein